MPKSLYEVLGVARTATTDEIRKAYRKLAKTAHPDVGGDLDEFARMAKANEILTDPEEREHYDQTGKEGISRITADDMAMECLLAHLGQAVEKSLMNAGEPNLKAFAIGSMQQEHRAVANDVQQFEKRAERLDLARKKLKPNIVIADEDRVLMRIKGMADVNGRNLEQANGRLKHISDAMALLQRYDWDEGTPPMQHLSGFGASTNSRY